MGIFGLQSVGKVEGVGWARGWGFPEAKDVNKLAINWAVRVVGGVDV